MEHVVLFDNLSKLEANMIEKDLIYYYKKIHKSYNVADGGEGKCGVYKERICQYDKTTGELIKI